MQDRSSRPHHQPGRAPAAIEEQVVRLRREHRIGPARLAARCGIAASTAHRILRRHGLPALAATDRATGEPVRRYERAHPGELLHIDVKKLGRITDGGGHKVLGRAAGSPVRANSAAPAAVRDEGGRVPADGRCLHDGRVDTAAGRSTCLVGRGDALRWCRTPQADGASCKHRPSLTCSNASRPRRVVAVGSVS